MNQHEVRQFCRLLKRHPELYNEQLHEMYLKNIDQCSDLKESKSESDEGGSLPELENKEPIEGGHLIIEEKKEDIKPKRKPRKPRELKKKEEPIIS